MAVLGQQAYAAIGWRSLGGGGFKQRGLHTDYCMQTVDANYSICTKVIFHDDFSITWLIATYELEFPPQNIAKALYSREEAQKMVLEEMARWENLIKEAGIKA